MIKKRALLAPRATFVLLYSVVQSDFWRLSALKEGWDAKR